MSEQSQHAEIDAVLNNLAMDTLSFMSEKLKGAEGISESDQVYVMLHACEAMTFNIIMHIAEQTQTPPSEIAEKTKANLMDALKNLELEMSSDSQH